MDCISTLTAYKNTNAFSGITLDYLAKAPALRPFYRHEVSLDGVAGAIAARKAFPVDRKLLTEVLLKQYENTPASQETMNNIKSLLQENTFAVTTAHQPNLFTGYLYFIYKILHTIKLCESFKTQFPGNHFVPVFFMGSEDADLDELGKVFMGGEKIVWNTPQTGAVGRMRTSGLAPVIERIEGELGVHEYGPALIAMLKEYYDGEADMQTATFKLVNRLFARYGLIVLLPDNAGLKSAMLSVFKDDLWRQTPSSLVEKTIKELGAHYKVQANPREINLFYLRDDIRERIVRTTEGWKVVNHEIRFSEEELEEELRCHPERFSPNVILRGLFQEIILPGVAFVGGSGELAYWLELKALFDHYGVPYPVLILRNSFLFIESKWAENIRKLGLETGDLFKNTDLLINELVIRSSSLQLSLPEEIKELEAFYKRLETISVTADPGLARHVAALKTKSVHQLEKLEKKLLRAGKRKSDAGVRRVIAIRKALFPDGHLQERFDNFMPYYARWGDKFIDTIYRHSQTLEQQFAILSETGEAAPDTRK